MCQGLYHLVYIGYRARHGYTDFFFICQLGKYLEFSVAADLSPCRKSGSEVLKWCVKSEIFSQSPSVPAGLVGIQQEGRNGKARAWLSLLLQMLFDFYPSALNLGKPFFTC